MQKNKSVDSHTTVNWEEVKKEYITTKVSLRELSRKYEIPIATLQYHCKKEGWEKTVEQISNKVEQKIIEKISDARVSNADKAMRIIDKLMDKIEESIKVVKPGDVQATKQLVGAMKDLRDMGVFEVQTTDSNINVSFGTKETEDYAD